MKTPLYDDQQQDLAQSDKDFFNAHPDLQAMSDRSKTDEMEDLDKREGEQEKTKPKNALNEEDLENAENSDDTGEIQDTSEQRHIEALNDNHRADYFNDGPRAVKGRGLFARRKGLVGGGIGALLTLLAVSAISLPGLKLMHIAENIEERFFGSGEMITEKWTDKLMTNYVKKYLLPNIVSGACTDTRVDRSCVSTVDGNSLTSRLYRGWRDGSFETKLWENQGLAFEKRGATITMITREGAVDLPSGFGTSDTTLSEISGRNNIRRSYLDALNNESRFKKFYKKHKVGKFLERKYGIKRCVIACKTRDTFGDWKDNKKLAFKTKLVERVITPRSEMLGLIIECFINGGCDGRDGTDEDGARQTRFERSVDRKLAEYAQRFGTEAVQKIIEDSNALLADAASKGSLTRAVIERVVGNVFGQATGKTAGKAIPIIGWIDFIANGVHSVKQASSGLKKWVYVTQAATVVSTFALIATHSDEQRAGQVDLEILGSFVDAFGSDVGASAEEAPIYDYYFGSQSQSTSFLDFGGGTANAASDYTCNNGDPVSGLLCPEDSMGSKLALSTALGALTSNPAFSILNTVSSWWLGTAGKVFKELGEAAGAVISWIPGYDSLTGLIGEAAAPLFEFFGNYLVPSIFPDDLNSISGAKMLTATVAGGNVAGNDTMQYVLGGREVTPVEQAQILEEQNIYKQERYAALPLKDRIFDTTEAESYLSQFAMAMPLTSNPFNFFARNPLVSPSHIMSSISHLFMPEKASAAPGDPGEDPYGITQYGWPSSDPSLSIDPDILTDAYCADFEKQWIEAVYVDEDTGMDVHSTTNPCKINEVTIDSLLGVKDADDIAAENAAVGDFVAGVDPPVVDTADLPCPVTPTASEGYVTDARRGTLTVSIKLCRVHGYLINANMAKNFDDMYTSFLAAGFSFTGGGNFRSFASQDAMHRASPGSTAAPGQSNHELGLAVDTACANSDGGQPYTPWMPGKSRGLDEFQRAITDHPCLNWLHVNSRTFGLLLQCDGKGANGEIAARSGGCETWHISPTGK